MLQGFDGHSLLFPLGLPVTTYFVRWVTNLLPLHSEHGSIVVPFHLASGYYTADIVHPFRETFYTRLIPLSLSSLSTQRLSFHYFHSSLHSEL